MTLDVRGEAHGKEILDSLRKIYKDNSSIKVIDTH
jgi:hypothetical protein